MKVAVAHLKSVSPYSMSRYHDEPKLDKEAADDHEKRTWRERSHYLDDGRIFIPPMMFKKALETAASFLSTKIPGRRNATYTKHFKAGILVQDALVLNVKKDDVPGEWLFMNADGKPGSGTRVKRCFPVVHDWEGDVKFFVLDETITKDIFEKTLQEAGNFIGIGRFRPAVGGFYGRFTVEKVKWADA